MELTVLQPIPLLAEYIHHFWAIRAPASGRQRSVRLPADARGTLLLSFAGNTRFSGAGNGVYRLGVGAGLLGARARGSILEHDGKTEVIAAQFRPGGMAAFFDCNIRELYGVTTPLEALWGRQADRLLDQVEEARTSREKIGVYQEALRARVKEVRDRRRISTAVELMDSADQSVPIAWFASQACLTQKHFGRLFERIVGTTPKTYRRLARFQRTVTWLSRHGKPETWTALAIQFRYYDHSHMVKDFQAFAGTTPREFVAATAGITGAVYP